jgi:hypothetical protein
VSDRYPSEYTDDSSHAHAVALLERSGATAGVVVSLGCGSAPAAQPLTDLGFDYVGLDVDKASVDGLVKRGFEPHKIDLGISGARLVTKLGQVLSHRPLAAVLALDVLAHLSRGWSESAR